MPVFTTHKEGSRALVRVAPHDEPAATLFEMLDEVAFRPYNVGQPKELNLHLRRVDGDPSTHEATGEMDVALALATLAQLISGFEQTFTSLAAIGERQVRALVEFAARKADERRQDAG